MDSPKFRKMKSIIKYRDALSKYYAGMSFSLQQSYVDSSKKSTSMVSRSRDTLWIIEKSTILHKQTNSLFHIWKLYAINQAEHNIFQTSTFKGFQQDLVKPENGEKTASSTPFGNCEFLRMPFSLKNIPSNFQSMMKYVLNI